MKKMITMPEYNGPPVCVGTGLLALDVVMNGNPNTPPRFYAGGSCGNVLTILSFLGWQTYPVARLSANKASKVLLDDLDSWNVKKDLISISTDGSTPVIIHRILTDKNGDAKHRFEFKDPSNGSYLPSYKPFLAKLTNQVISSVSQCRVFYFDRVNRASIELAKQYKSRGAIVFFEPSSNREEKLFNECLDVCDIIKFSADRIKDYESHYPLPVAKIEIRTKGDAGLEIRTETNPEWITIPSFSIDNVLDTAGAGDWCSAGLIYKLSQYPSFDAHEFDLKEIIESIRFGQALSAFNCTFKGAREMMYNYLAQDMIINGMEALKAEDRRLTGIMGTTKKITSYSEHIEISSLL